MPINIYSETKSDALIVKRLQLLFPAVMWEFTSIDDDTEVTFTNTKGVLLPLDNALDRKRNEQELEIIPISLKESPIPLIDELTFYALLFHKNCIELSNIVPFFSKPIHSIANMTAMSISDVEFLQRATVVVADKKELGQIANIVAPDCTLMVDTTSEEELEKKYYTGEMIVVLGNCTAFAKYRKGAFVNSLLKEECMYLFDYGNELLHYKALIEKFGGSLTTDKDCATIAFVATAENSLSSQIYSLLLERYHEQVANKPGNITFLKRRKPSLMIQGTCSNAGKSVLTSAFGRILFQDGYAVAPFKAQNMALNSFVTVDGLEIGRAQAVQAQACKLIPDVRMNPLLLKPTKDTGSQVVLMGKPVGTLSSREFTGNSKMRLFDTITNAYDSLQDEYDVTVIEGAGSPGEVNLKESDIVNMRMARYAQSPVLLAGDIDRGGIYASFLGTYNTFNFYEKELLKGYLINRFRGDASLLKPADEYILRQTGKPVLGTIPFVKDLNIPEEDCFFFDLFNPREKSCETLDVALIGVPHISNFTDFTPLEGEPDIAMRPVFFAEEFGSPDVIILPGSKSVIADFLELQKRGLDRKIREAVARGAQFIGVCGGLQMAGQTIHDPHSVETTDTEVCGLGLLPIHTTMNEEKQLSQTCGIEVTNRGKIKGYEIHHGESWCEQETLISQRSEDGRVIGYEKENIWLTYLHGIFDDDTYRREFINRLRVKKGLQPLHELQYVYDIESSLNRLADVVRESVDMKQIYTIMGL